MSYALALITLVSAHRLLVGVAVMLGLLLRCGQACAADEAAPPQLCPPQFVSAASGQTLEAHATACADWAQAAPDADSPDAAAPAPADANDWRHVAPAAGPVSALGAAGAGGVAREASLAMAEAQHPATATATGWRQVPALRWLGQLRMQGGGLVLHDAGAQYFVKLRGIRGVRMGFKLAF